MKRSALLFIILVALLSCKKKYTCSCNTTFYFQGGQENFIAKSTPISEKLTKKQAQSVCDHETQSLDTLWFNFYTNYGNTPLGSGERFYSTCSLK